MSTARYCPTCGAAIELDASDGEAAGVQGVSPPEPKAALHQIIDELDLEPDDLRYIEDFIAFVAGSHRGGRQSRGGDAEMTAEGE